VGDGKIEYNCKKKGMKENREGNYADNSFDDFDTISIRIR
jgi:hypothetical protein